MGWLFILVPLAVIVAVVVYYQRQSKAREAASQERFKALLSSVRQGAQSGQPGAVLASAASAKSADATVQRSAEFLAPLAHKDEALAAVMSAARKAIGGNT